MLVRCVYASRPRKAMSPELLDSILAKSWENNPARGITGLLCFTPQVFVQVLEGGRDEVCELYNAIVRDDRHGEVRLLCYEEIGERRFGNWTMGKVDVGQLNPAQLLKYSARAQFDPYAASGGATMRLLDELVASGAIVSRTG